MTGNNVFLPYRVKNSGKSFKSVLDKCSADCIAASQYVTLNPVSYYEKALQGLTSIKNCSIRPMDRFMDDFAGKEQIIVGMRHDVDHDIVTAARMSRLEKEYGISASFYILHSHPFVHPGYYAEFDNESKTLLRNEALAEVYLAMQENGSEIGLHVDAVRLYQQGIDGMQAILAELEWLRSAGLNIHGIAGHNSAFLDGCENFEFFSEYHLNHSPYIYELKQPVRLGVLSAKELGITYEANYAKACALDGLAEAKYADLQKWLQFACNREKSEFLRSCLQDNKYCEWGADVICWLYERDCWAVSQKGGIYKGNASLKDVLEITENSRGKRVLWHIHPFFCGLRS